MNPFFCSNEEFPPMEWTEGLTLEHKFLGLWWAWLELEPPGEFRRARALIATRLLQLGVVP